MQLNISEIEDIRQENLPLFLTIQEFTLDKVKEWIQVLADLEDGSVASKALEDLIDLADKSTLLERLLRGESATPTVIKSYGHPWYSLIENGEDICADAWQSKPWVNGQHTTIFRIDGEAWEIEEEISDDELIIYYRDDPDKKLFKFSRVDKGDIEKYLHPRIRKLSDGKEKYSWKLQILENVDESADDE